MAKPSSRQELIDYCLRQLGEPVLEINVDDDQIEDAVDDAIQFFHERHFDGVEKMYLKHKITQDMIDAARSNTVATTGISSDKFDGSSASVVSVSADNITIPNHGLVTGSPIEYSFGPGNTTIAIASATLDGAGVTTALGIGTDSQKLYAIADNRNQIRLAATAADAEAKTCLLYTSPSPRDKR